MRRVALLISALSTGCAAPAADRAKAYSAEMEAYLVCNMQASKVVSAQAGDPMSLAVAARGLCTKEELALTQKINATYSPDLANKIRARLREMTVDQNTTSIVTFRASKQ